MTREEARKLLGLAVGASAEEVQRAYRREARRWHPDICDALDAAARFKAISDARVVLLNPDPAGAEKGEGGTIVDVIGKLAQDPDTVGEKVKTHFDALLRDLLGL